MVYSIFTYMNGWCFFGKCRYIYQSHGSYEVVIVDHVDRCGLTPGFEKERGFTMKDDNLPPKIYSGKNLKSDALELNDLRALKSRGGPVFSGEPARESSRVYPFVFPKGESWRLGWSKGLHFVVWNLVFSRRDLCIKSFQSGSRFHDLVFFLGGE